MFYQSREDILPGGVLSLYRTGRLARKAQPDAELEDLEVKLTPRGIQLQRCVKKDPLVDM